MDAQVGDVASWRRELHRHPELLYDLPKTSGFVADKLRAFGCDEVAAGVGRSGVVGVVHGRHGPGPVTGLRADMDALPISEDNPGLPHASSVSGRMHACGHDGHTAMLLGAARRLCAERDFAGTAVLVFQPAEEGGAGARAMLADGLVHRFGLRRIFAMHNLPGLPIGHFATRAGSIMAASDTFEIVVTGRGGHAALPHRCADPVLAGAAIVTALQGIVSRSVDPLDSCVVSVTRFEGGSARNAIPDKAVLGGTVRTLNPVTRDAVEARLRAIARGTAEAHETSASVAYSRGYPVTINEPAAASFAAAVAGEVAQGPGAVDAGALPTMGAEDFAYMLEALPGAFVFLGNGDSAGLHSPRYDFDDAALVHGMRFWVRLVQAAGASP